MPPHSEDDRVEDFDPIVTPSDREALRRGYRFDPIKANRPVRFIEAFCRQSIGEFSGQPLILLPWQKHLLWRAFGWVDEEGFRRHRDLYLEVPKKNGKGELASALAIFMLLADGESVPIVALAAVDSKQARNTLDESVRMVRRSPALSKKLVVSDFYKTVRCPSNGGVIEVHSSEVDAKDGGNYSAVFIDELHRWTGAKRRAWNVYSGSGASRRQPLRVVTSTAGEDRGSVMFEQHNRALAIESGDLIDTTFCSCVYGPRPGEAFDPHDEATWARFNPSLGTTMSLSGFRADYEANRHSPASFQYWRRTRLNEWSQEAARYIDRDKLAACPPRRTREAIFESGDPWFAGIDLSSTRDLTALVLVAGNLDDGLDVFCHAWVPEEEAVQRAKSTGVPYLEWAERGFLTLTKGARIDYREIVDAIDDEFTKTAFKSIYGDWYNANAVNASLAERGIPFKVIRQGPLSQNGPVKEMERLIAEGLLRIGENPVLRWALSNVVAETDKAGNVMISKSKSSEKVDPAQALANSIAGSMDGRAEAAKTPTYDPAPKMQWVSVRF